MSDLEPLVRAPPRGAREPAVTIGAAPSPHEASDLVSVEDAVRRATAERERLARLAAEHPPHTGPALCDVAGAVGPPAPEAGGPHPRAGPHTGPHRAQQPR